MPCAAGVLAVLALALSAPGAPARVHFSPSATFATGRSDFAAIGIVAGDFSRDGREDLAVLNQVLGWSAGFVSVLPGNGRGGYGPPVYSPTGPDQPGAFAEGNLNGDENPDFAVTNLHLNTVSVLLGNGSDGFGPPTGFRTGARPVDVAVHDLDGDRKADLAVANVDSEDVSVLLGDGTGRFRPATPVPTGKRDVTRLVVTDLDSDAHPDIVALSVGRGGVLLVMLGDGAGGFGPPTAYPAGASPLDVAAGDLNGDGDPDLAIAESDLNSDPSTREGGVAVLAGDGAGGFGPPTTYRAGGETRQVAIHDLDGDGHPDIVANNTQPLNALSVRINDGTGRLGLQTTVPAAPDYESLGAPADLDHDRLDDLVVLDNNTGEAHVLHRRPEPGALVVDELRTRGPGGATDDYVELTNAAPYMFDPSTARLEYPDASGNVRSVALPNRILAPGEHVLLAGRGYDLTQYGTPDGTLSADLPDGGGVRVRGFDGVLDAAGCATAGAGFREGAGLDCPGAGPGGDYTLVRRQTAEAPVDTGDNRADFALAADPAPVFGGLDSVFGAPAPQGTADPRPRPYVHVALFDPGAAADASPNRTYNPATQVLKVRRSYTNTSAFRVVSRLRLRLIGLSTVGDAGPADALLSLNSDPGDTVDGRPLAATTLEQPPAQPDGGGLNSSLSVDLPAGGLLPGHRVNVNLRFHVDRTGDEHVAVRSEALAHLLPPSRR